MAGGYRMGLSSVLTLAVILVRRQSLRIGLRQAGALAGLADVFLLLCVVWALMVITGGNLPGLNEAALGGSVYYTIFSRLNPFMGAAAVG